MSQNHSTPAESVKLKLDAQVKSALETEAERQGVSIHTLISRVLSSHVQAAHVGYLRVWRPFEDTYLSLLNGLNGVYIIRCAANGRIYVGQTENLMHRLKTHRYGIVYGNHPNDSIRFDSQVYGISQFTFDVLEFIDDPTTGHERERYWFDLLGASTLRGNYNQATPSEKPVKRRAPNRRLRPGVHI